ncbi:MAG: hypothetical protein HN348_18040, partial [Proteobacteria bacterium]|nr:hypothetical protein [Pseudomonadota bacterium]
MMLVVLFLSFRALATPCPAPTSTEEMVGVLDRAESAYQSLDIDGFQLAFEESVLILPCVDAPLTPDLAGAFHRIQG